MLPDLASLVESINQAWNSHDIENVLSYYSSDCIGDDVSQAALLSGHEGLRNMLSAYWKAFPDLQFEVTDAVVQDSRMAIAWVAQGTHLGSIMHIPPTGHKIAVRGMSLIQVENGLIIRGQYIWDLAGMLRHMGLLPEL